MPKCGVHKTETPLGIVLEGQNRTQVETNMVFDWSISGNRLGLLHIHLVYLRRLCVDLDDILVLCMTVCCMTTLLMLDHMLHVCMGHTCIPLSLNH